MGVGKSRKFNASFSILVTLFFSLMAGVVAHAQVTGATLSGTVTDPSGGVLVGAGDAHDVGAGLLEALDLGDRRLDVVGQRVGHRLHGDRRIAADGDLADEDLPTLATVNVPIGPDAHKLLARCFREE